MHNRFEELVTAEGNLEFFGETGYLGGAIVTRDVSGFFPKGTTAPDAVFGLSATRP